LVIAFTTDALSSILPGMAMKFLAMKILAMKILAMKI
jgi:hypothetical protein